MQPTTPAPADTERSELTTTSPCAMGTIGFDLYLVALQLSRGAFSAPRLPTRTNIVKKETL